MAILTNVKEPPVPYPVESHPMMLIKEEKKVYPKHDQLFKELIDNFFVALIFLKRFLDISIGATNTFVIAFQAQQ